MTISTTILVYGLSVLVFSAFVVLLIYFLVTVNPKKKEVAIVTKSMSSIESELDQDEMPLDNEI